MLKPLIFTVTVATLSTGAWAQGKHVHGEGTLEVVLDRNVVVLSLTLPMDVAVGFERPPRNAQEHAELDKAIRVLNEPEGLWTWPAQAECKYQGHQVEKPQFKGGHADLLANYSFECAKPAALQAGNTVLFAQFKRLKQLDVQVVGSKGQTAARLTAKRTQFDLSPKR